MEGVNMNKIEVSPDKLGRFGEWSMEELAALSQGAFLTIAENDEEAAQKYDGYHSVLVETVCKAIDHETDNRVEQLFLIASTAGSLAVTAIALFDEMQFRTELDGL